jgi:hypothetical protein
MPPVNRIALQRTDFSFVALHLALGNHVHELDTAQQDARAAKVLESKHCSGV